LIDRERGLVLFVLRKRRRRTTDRDERVARGGRYSERQDRHRAHRQRPSDPPHHSPPDPENGPQSRRLCGRDVTPHPAAVNAAGHEPVSALPSRLRVATPTSGARRDVPDDPAQPRRRPARSNSSRRQADRLGCRTRSAQRIAGVPAGWLRRGHSQVSQDGMNCSSIKRPNCSRDSQGSMMREPLCRGLALSRTRRQRRLCLNRPLDQGEP
jgi:hypothetical protein